MRNPGVGIARELMTVPCGRWCVLMHSVVVRDGDGIRTQSYGDTPFTFTPGAATVTTRGAPCHQSEPTTPALRQRPRRGVPDLLSAHGVGWASLPRILARANVTQPTAAAAAAGATAGAAHIYASGRNPRRWYAGGRAGRKMTRRELQR